MTSYGGGVWTIPPGGSLGDSLVLNASGDLVFQPPENGANLVRITGNAAGSANGIVFSGNGNSFFQVANFNSVLLSIPLHLDVGQTTLNGTTAGTFAWAEHMQGQSWKRLLGVFNGYENTSGVSQTIAFPQAFSQMCAIVFLSSSTTVQSAAASTITGSGLAVSTTTLTLPNTMTVAYNGLIVVEGV